MLIDYSKRRAGSVSQDDMILGRSSGSGSSLCKSPSKGLRRHCSYDTSHASEQTTSPKGVGPELLDTTSTLDRNSTHSLPAKLFNTEIQATGPSRLVSSGTSTNNDCTSSTQSGRIGRAGRSSRSPSKPMKKGTADVQEDSFPLASIMRITPKKHKATPAFIRCETSELVRKHRHRRPTILIESEDASDNDENDSDDDSDNVSIISEGSFELPGLEEELGEKGEYIETKEQEKKEAVTVIEWCINNTTIQKPDIVQRSSSFNQKNSSAEEQKVDRRSTFVATRQTLSTSSFYRNSTPGEKQRVDRRNVIKKSLSTSNLMNNKGDISFRMRRHADAPSRSKSYDDNHHNMTSFNRLEQSLSSILNVGGEEAVKRAAAGEASHSLKMPHSPKRPEAASGGPLLKRMRDGYLEENIRLNLSLSSVDISSECPSCQSSRRSLLLSASSSFSSLNSSSSSFTANDQNQHYYVRSPKRSASNNTKKNVKQPDGADLGYGNAAPSHKKKKSSRKKKRATSMQNACLGYGERAPQKKPSRNHRRASSLKDVNLGYHGHGAPATSKFSSGNHPKSPVRISTTDDSNGHKRSISMQHVDLGYGYGAPDPRFGLPPGETDRVPSGTRSPVRTQQSKRAASMQHVKLDYGFAAQEQLKEQARKLTSVSDHGHHQHIALGYGFAAPGSAPSERERALSPVRPHGHRKTLSMQHVSSTGSVVSCQHPNCGHDKTRRNDECPPSRYDFHSHQLKQGRTLSPKPKKTNSLLKPQRRNSWGSSSEATMQTNTVSGSCRNSIQTNTVSGSRRNLMGESRVRDSSHFVTGSRIRRIDKGSQLFQGI